MGDSSHGICGACDTQLDSRARFTCLVGVALNDQSADAPHGQFGVLKGGHKLVQRHFQQQRTGGGIVGPEGEGWPRIKVGHRAGNPAGRPFINGLPDPVWAACYTGAEARGSAAWYGPARLDPHHACTRARVCSSGGGAAVRRRSRSVGTGPAEVPTP